MSRLTIVMYHYVRPISGSRFPGIKGLELEGFKRQLDFLSDKYNIVNTEQVINSCLNDRPLPDDACWLTFDDGYSDHYDFVFPELISRGLQAAFFPPSAAIQDNIILDVNAVHHILSCVNKTENLINSIHSYCLKDGISNNQLKFWQEKFSVASRYDDAETIYIKRLLQHVLPEKLRNAITNELFRDYVGVSTQEFSKTLYMSHDQVRQLVASGMYVGSHGVNHFWLNKISDAEQLLEISGSLEFLESIGSPTKNWIMCYPYGAYNKSTISFIRKYSAAAAITTEVSVADLKINSRFALPRMDTNDFPQ